MADHVDFLTFGTTKETVSLSDVPSTSFPVTSLVVAFITYLLRNKISSRQASSPVSPPPVVVKAIRLQGSWQPAGCIMTVSLPARGSRLLSSCQSGGFSSTLGCNLYLLPWLHLTLSPATTTGEPGEPRERYVHLETIGNRTADRNFAPPNPACLPAWFLRPFLLSNARLHASRREIGCLIVNDTHGLGLEWGWSRS